MDEENDDEENDDEDDGVKQEKPFRYTYGSSKYSRNYGRW